MPERPVSSETENIQHTDGKGQMTDNAKQIGQSKAGRRFIAQMNFYNAGDFKRLRQFMRGGYYDLVLMEHPIDRRILDLKTARKLRGRLKVAEVEVAEEHRIKLIMQPEKGNTKLRLEMVVNEDYPHQIIHYSLLPIDDQ
jgi:hypothetical protein